MDLVRAGRVTLNGRVCKGANTHVDSDTDVVCVDGVKLPPPVQLSQARLWLYHKVMGEVVSHSDPQGRRTPFKAALEAGFPPLRSAGRLDLGTEGLMLLSDCASLVRTLEHPSGGFMRTYLAEVANASPVLSGTAPEVSADMHDSLAAGITLRTGAAFRPIFVDCDDRAIASAHAHIVGTGASHGASSMSGQTGSGTESSVRSLQRRLLKRHASAAHQSSTRRLRGLRPEQDATTIPDLAGTARCRRWFRIKLFEGKTHEVRRALAHFDFDVLRLVRVAFGPFHLGDLPPGQLEEADVRGEELSQIRARAEELEF